MTDIAAFRGSLAGAAAPVGTGFALKAPWWVAKGDWDRAHGCVQSREGKADCDLVYARLHRREGDLANAGYWYRRAGQPAAENPVEAA